MSRDRFDEILKLAAATYNVPPAAPPREEMWSRIRAARSGSGEVSALPGVVAAGGPAAPVRARVHFPVFPSKGGIHTSRLRISSRRTEFATPLADAGGHGTRIGRRRGWLLASSSVLAAAALLAVAQLRPGTMPWLPESSSPSGENSVQASAGWVNVQFPALAAGFGIGRFASGSPDAWFFAADDDPVVEAFKRVALAHLKRSETVITSFRGLSPEDATGRQMRSTLRELLSATRLLISSPVSARTQYRLVFQDLELVLMKMAVVSPETLASDRAQIETTLERRRLLPRMRELMPQPTSANAN